MSLGGGQRARVTLVNDQRILLQVQERLVANRAVGRPEAVIQGIDVQRGLGVQIALSAIRDAEVQDRSARVGAGGAVALGVVGSILGTALLVWAGYTVVNAFR